MRRIVPAMDIRDATNADAAAIARLLGELGYPDNEVAVRRRLARFRADPASRVQVAVIERDVVGLVATHLVPRFDSEELSCRIVDLVVGTNTRRQGVARELIAAVEAQARSGGANRIDVASAEHRGDAHAFYRALGFDGRSRNFSRRLA
jgi:N-acetylglutamate synthase-like GNAT family acetyltransferase